MGVWPKYFRNPTCYVYSYII